MGKTRHRIDLGSALASSALPSRFLDVGNLRCTDLRIRDEYPRRDQLGGRRGNAPVEINLMKFPPENRLHQR
jgi:hypothetical protein